MAEKVYLTSDQYVVKLLSEKEEEIAKLNEKYDDLLKRFVTLQVENKKYEELKKWFSLEETSTRDGYQLVIGDVDSYCKDTIAYCWNKEKPEQEFLDLLELVGIEFPGGNK